jgi:hypothetical protein
MQIFCKSTITEKIGIALTIVVLLMPVAATGELNQGVAGTTLEVLFPGSSFDPAIPTQAEVTGVEPGARPLRSEEVLAFYRALADASPRARLMEYARSYEGRPLVILAISDEKTIADLDAFKSEHAALMDPRIEARGDLDTAKAVAWMAYGIHGDELSSTDASSSLAYWLIAGEDDRARALRDRLVILIDPNENPDGRSRYLAQTLSFAHRSANPDQDDLSHATVWPWGRGNHYLFDMNRDWFTLVNPESARSRSIAAWIPQLMLDCHEMGDDETYLFSPPRHPFNPHLPSNTIKWQVSFSEDQAAALDERGFPYFTREWNEEFFPGYGSSWASYHGAIGILYEMSGTSGTLVHKRGGTVRTFAQAVEHQVASSVSNLESLATNAKAVLTDQRNARQQAITAGLSGEVKAWLFPPDTRHPGRLGDFAELLEGQGIEVQVLHGGPVKARGLTDARTGKTAEVDLGTGTLLVRLDQPAGFLARVILDPHVAMEEGFFQDEREHLEKGEGSRLYETTAWSVVLGRGLPAFWSSAEPPGDWNPWAPTPQPQIQLLTGSFNSVIVDGDPDSSPRALADLLQAGVTVRIAERPFAISGRSFRRGALVIRTEGNVEDLEEVLNRVASNHGAELFPVGTSRSEEGPDLGGSHFPVLVPPRVGVLTGMPVSPTAYGSIWHLLDQELNLRFSSLDIGWFGFVDLSRYNVLVFPPVFGGASMYHHLLGTDGADRMRQWIEAGGTAIGIGEGARMLAAKETGLTMARFRSEALESLPPPVWSIGAGEAELAGRPTAIGLRVQPTDPPENKQTTKKDTKPAPVPHRASPYDVAPVLGPGALPFTKGHEQGTPLAAQPIPMDEWLEEILPPVKMEPEESEIKKADERLRSFMPQGVMVRAELDDEFWMNFGLGEDITVWFGGGDTIVAAPPVSVAARFPEIDRLHLGGLLWPEAAARMAHTAYATRETVGRGQVILFADRPAYRRWMRETERILINAILLGPGLGTRWSTPW